MEYYGNNWPRMLLNFQGQGLQPYGSRLLIKELLVEMTWAMVYDLFDLGEFDQKGSVRTKYGTLDEYLEAIKVVQEHKTFRFMLI